MKKLIFIILLLSAASANAWVYDARFPTFEVEGVKFALTTQEDETGLSVVVLFWNGAQWLSWGGYPDVRGIIAEGVTDGDIMQHGSLHEYMEWCAVEAVKRARLKVELPLPNPDDRLARLRYNMLKSYVVEPGGIKLAPAPLP